MKQFTTILVLVVIFISGAVFTYTLVQALWYVPEQEVPLPEGDPRTARHHVPSTLPDRLIIKRLGIDTDVQHVGIGKSGNMAVPSNYSDVGWFRYGTVPGEIGSAVMDGHVDNGFGLDGVFKDLHTLRPGDKIVVVARDGKEIQFEVEQVVTYPYDKVPPELLFERSDRARLNLITCGGTWIKEKETYDRRVVVYAVLAE